MNAKEEEDLNLTAEAAKAANDNNANVEAVNRSSDLVNSLRKHFLKHRPTIVEGVICGVSRVSRDDG